MNAKYSKCAILALILACWLGNLHSQESYEDSLLNLMNEMTDEESTGIILSNLIWHNRRNYDRAIELLSQADALAEKYDRTDLKARYSYNRGCVHRFAGNFTKGISSLHKAEILYIELKDTFNIANSNYQIGACYSNLGSYDLSQIHYYKALEYFEYISDSSGMALVMNGIAVDLRKVGRKEEAIGFYNRALEIYRKQNSLSGMADVLHNLGNLHAESEDYDMALKHYKEQEIYDRKTNYTAGIAYLHKALGQVYQLKGEPKKAIIEHNKSIKLWDSLQNQKFVASNHIKKSMALADLGRYNDGQFALKRGMAWAQKEQDKQEILEAYGAYAYLYEKMNIPYESINYLKKYEQLKDTLRNEDVRAQINELNAKYNTAQKDAQIDALALENELEKAKLKARTMTLNLWGAGITLLLLTSLGILYRNGQRSKIRELLYQKEIQDNVSKIDQLSERIGDLLLSKNQLTLRPREEINQLLDTPLSSKEYEVLTSVAGGQSNKEISAEHFISENTVKFHLKNIYFKLDVHNRKEAVKKVASIA